MSRGPVRVYIGDLPRDVREHEIDDQFRKFGRIGRLNVKEGYAFVDYDDDRDAHDAVKDMDGRVFLGRRVRVEFAKPPRESRDGGRGGYDRGFDAGYARPPRRERTGYRVLVTGLSRDTSWQDLKDFGRECGPVLFSGVSADASGANVGVLEYEQVEDMRDALRRLDGKDLKGEKVTVEEEKPDRSFKGMTGGGGGGGVYGGSRPSGGDRRRDDDRDRRDDDRDRGRADDRDRGRDDDRGRDQRRDRSRSRSRERRDEGRRDEQDAPAREGGY